MSLVLAEAAKLSQDVLLKGVIETIITESDILKHLPFIDIVGNGLTYNQENTLPAAGFYSPNDTWVESTPTFTQHTATLAILGGDADVDEFLRQTRSNVQNLKAIVTDLKSKAVARTFEDTFVYGNVATNSKSFNGLHALMPAANRLHAGTLAIPSVAGAGSMRKLKELIRMVKPNGPDFLLMSRTTRDNISDYAERDESPVRISGRDDMGKPIMYFGGVRVICTDWILQTELSTDTVADYSAKIGGVGTSIFACKFGEKLLAGCQNGGVQIKDLGDLETKDATRARIKWYVSLALFNTLALARYDGISDAAWSA